MFVFLFCPFIKMTNILTAPQGPRCHTAMAPETLPAGVLHLTRPTPPCQSPRISQYTQRLREQIRRQNSR